jgi:hypothetical protein
VQKQEVKIVVAALIDDAGEDAHLVLEQYHDYFINDRRVV